MVKTANRVSAVPFERLFEAMAAPLGWAETGALLRSPDTEVIETEEAIQVVMEVPGVRRDDLDIGLEDNVLTVRATKPFQQVQNARYHLSERRYGTFTRSFVLPRQVDAENIDASFADGVLHIMVPKSEQARRRRIEIRGGTQENAQLEESTANENR